ncbi:MAG: hypothetical protein H6734_28110 [Alphaproteobacteria bacterium]|nr:hypothetical protein [Alphaproteobacteria bacterium]
MTHFTTEQAWKYFNAEPGINGRSEVWADLYRRGRADFRVQQDLDRWRIDHLFTDKPRAEPITHLALKIELATLAGHMGVEPPVLVADPAAGNAYAEVGTGSLGEDQRIVGYNPAWIETVYQYAGLEGVRFIWAHELSHHILGHTAFDSGSAAHKAHNHAQELAADAKAADLMARLGMPLHSVDGWMSMSSARINSEWFTHPSNLDRSNNAASAFLEASNPTGSVTLEIPKGQLHLEVVPLASGSTPSIAVIESKAECSLYAWHEPHARKKGGRPLFRTFDDVPDDVGVDVDPGTIQLTAQGRGCSQYGGNAFAKVHHSELGFITLSWSGGALTHTSW